MSACPSEFTLTPEGKGYTVWDLYYSDSLARSGYTAPQRITLAWDSENPNKHLDIMLPREELPFIGTQKILTPKVWHLGMLNTWYWRRWEDLGSKISLWTSLSTFLLSEAKVFFPKTSQKKPLLQSQPWNLKTFFLLPSELKTLTSQGLTLHPRERNTAYKESRRNLGR